MLLHEQIRKARLEAGLSQMNLAREAGIQRSLLQNLEDGRNVTLDTLRKVVARLPALQSLDLGAIVLEPGITHELRHEAEQMMAAAQRILTLLDSIGAAPAPAPAPDPAGATRFEGSTEVSPERRERLKEMVTTVRAGDGKKGA
jgi:transcriptional regulator with XRE-family HTH domain